MTHATSFACLILSLLCLYVPNCFGIKILLPSTGEKCIQEEFTPNVLVTGTLEVTPPAPDKGLQVKIVENGNVLYENPKLTDKGTFAFTSQDVTYDFCFKEDGSGGLADTKRMLDIKFRIDPTSEQPDVAKKEQLQPLEKELKKLR